MLLMTFNLEQSFKKGEHEFLKEREIDVLTYYMLYGYNDRAKGLIKKAWKWESSTLRQYDYKLTKKGCLTKIGAGKRNKKADMKLRGFSPDLLKILKIFQSKAPPRILFQFD